MRSAESLGPGGFAALAGLIAFTAATAAGVVLFGNPAGEAATRAVGAAVGVAVATYVLRRWGVA